MAEETKKCTCPLCGSDQYVESKLDDEVQDAFLESMLGGVPFTRTYDVMHGKLSITVQASDEEVNRKKAKLYIVMGTASEYSEDLKAYMPLIESYMDVDSQVSAVTINGAEYKRTPCSGILKVVDMGWGNKDNDTDWHAFVDNVLKEFEHCMFGDVKVPIAIMKGAVAKHNILIGKLIKECLDENFLGGTGR